MRAGTITSIKLDQNTLHAIVTVDVTQGGFGAFHADAFCQSRPQSLIGEYFIDCQPGQRGPVLAPGSTIPVTHTQSTIPADLLLNVLRLPYRQRMALIINELGAAVGGRSGDIAGALAGARCRRSRRPTTCSTCSPTTRARCAADGRTPTRS